MHLLILDAGRIAVLALIFLGAGFFAWKASKASKSGTQQQGMKYSNENIPIVQTGWFWLALVVFVIGIAALIYMVTQE